MKRSNKKGFTIVELVIVIAVIAILAGVLIPTFAGVVDNAKKSAALQEAKSMYSEYIGTFNFSNGEEPVEKVYVVVDSYKVLVDNGNVSIVEDEATIANIPQLRAVDGVYTTAAEDAGNQTPAASE